jgi:DNA invertase Pin-like site-specific DNA recombinase
VRALGYIRVSKLEQGASDRYSLPEQDKRLREYCAQRSLTLVDILQDVETGRHNDRQHYQQLLTRLRQGEAGCVVVRWLDRFGRNTREILTRIWELQDLGIQVEASDEDLSHELIRLIRAWQAGDESRKIGERTKPALHARAAQGKWNGRIAWGMRYSASGKPEPDPDPQYRSVDLAFECYDPPPYGRGYSLPEIAHHLTALGLPTPKGGPRWSWTTIATMLRHEVYVGDLRRNGAHILDNHPGRVPRERFERVQARLTGHRYNRIDPAEKMTPLGVGLVYCECGARMTPRYGRVKGRVYSWFYCLDWCRYRYCPTGNTSIATNQVERQLVALARTWRVRSEVAESVEASVAGLIEDTGDARQEIAELEARLAKLRAREKAYLEDLADRVITREQFRQVIGPLTGDIERLSFELSSLRRRTERRGETVEQMIRGVRAILRVARDGVEPSDLQAILVEAAERIVVKADHTLEVIWRPEYRGIVES